MIEQVLACFDAQSATFRGTYAGAELDLMITHRGKRYGFECKCADAPGSTRSIQVALRELKLSHLFVVYPGDERYQLDDRLTVLPAREIPRLAGELTPARG